MEEIVYKGRGIPVSKLFDTVIVGGGTAGAAAGIQSAKMGDSTLIIEKMAALGGTAVHGLVSPMMASHVKHGVIIQEIEEALQMRKIKTRDGYSDSLWFSSEEMAFCLETLYIKYGGKLLYDASFVDSVVENGRIEAVIVMTQAGLLAVYGTCFIDASGDAILARSSGVPANSGDKEGKNQISSLRFEIGGIDVEMYRRYCQRIQDEFCPMKEGEYFESAMVAGRGFALEPLFIKGVEAGLLNQEDLHYYQCFTIPEKTGSMSFNCPHLLHVEHNTNPWERSEGIVEGHRIIRRLAAFLKAYMPGFEQSYLQKEASMIGIRESFRIVGQYMLTEEDYVSRARFEDGVVKGDWYIDVHSAYQGLIQKSKYEPGEYYEIPYRSLVSREVENLITVGRCISASFLMQASIRIQPTLVDMGQAAGEACYYSIKHGIPLASIDGRVFRRGVEMKRSESEISVIHHTHWDREWYQTFECMQIRFRDGIRRVMDYIEEGVIENFYLDGQTCILDDYRQIVSEKEYGRLEEHLRQKRLQIGPWYVLADEFLCPPEACIMNLELGRKMAKEYGSFCDVGYLPDTFGHTGAMPQILQGFGIECAVVWRGTDPKHAEVWWEGSGGGRVRTLVLSTRDGYYQVYLKHETWEEELDRYFKFNREEKNWRVPVLMDGADHTVCDAGSIGRLRAYESSRQVILKDSLMDDVCSLLKETELKESIRGELRDPAKIFVLSGTWSARMYLKMMNQSCVDTMVYHAQFLQAWEKNASDSDALLESLWKQILVNQAHDSICGCSLDEVHEDMENRFKRIMFSLKQYETSVLERLYPFCYTHTGIENRWLHILHSTPYDERCIVSASIQIDKSLDLGGIALFDDGCPVPMQVVRRKEAEEFYHDTMAEPWYGHTVTYEVEFDHFFEGFHHKCLEIRRCPPPLISQNWQQVQIENEYYTIYEENNEITVMEKQTGRVHQGQHGIVASMDAGDTYTYSPPECDYVCRALLIETECRCDAMKQTMEVRYQLDIPTGLSQDRTRAANERKKIMFHTTLVLFPGDPVIRVTSEFDNQGKDYRLRLEFPLEELTCHRSDVSFELVKRPVRQEAAKAAKAGEELIPAQDPANSMIYAGQLQIVHKGMQEYEINNREGKSFCYLTMLRCVGHLSRRDLRTRGGGAGPGYETPGAQCQGFKSFEYGLVYGEMLAASANSLKLKTSPLIKQSFVKTESEKHFSLEGDILFTGSRYFHHTWQVRMVSQNEKPGVITLHLPERRKVLFVNLNNDITGFAGEGTEITLETEPGKIITLRLEE